MMDLDEMRAAQAKGEPRRKAREERGHWGARTVDEAVALRRQAVEHATCCGGCFRPLAPTDTVTMGKRPVPHPWAGETIAAWANYRRRGEQYPEHEYLRVPLCLDCILDEIEKLPWKGLRNVSIRRGFSYADTSAWFRCRCEGCGRPMRIIRRDPVYSWTKPPARTRRVCCTECAKLVEKRRNSERRRVTHEPIACVECGEAFVPTRSDATTCSNRCRQAAHRARNRVTAA
jgi:hypothetical protein